MHYFLTSIQEKLENLSSLQKLILFGTTSSLNPLIKGIWDLLKTRKVFDQSPNQKKGID